MNNDENANLDLANYLHRRLEYLERCNAEIEEKISDDERDLCRQINEGVYNQNDPDLGKILFHLECVVGNTFRYTMLVGICSFLEEAMKAITKRLVANYDARIRTKKKGNWLKKHIQVLSDEAGLKRDSLKRELDTFHGLVELRNCIVHAWGKVANARDPATIQAVVQCMKSVEISKDGYLVFDDQVISEAIDAADVIVRNILVAKQ